MKGNVTKCIDTNVWIAYLVPEALQTQARNLIVPLLTSSTRLVAPAFGWVEVGSVLRKKVRLGYITAEQADGIYQDFCQMPIEYLDNDAIRVKTWAIAQQFSLATLYDAAFLAIAELEAAEFWTADETLLNIVSPSLTSVKKLGA